MSILSRFAKVGEAHLNRVADKLENPEVMLEQAIRDRTKQLQEAKKSVVSVMSAAKKTEKEYRIAIEAQTEWEEKAKLALQAGKEELATKALVRSEEYAQNAGTYAPLLESQDLEVDKLKQAIREMENDLEELKRKKDVILAQIKTAEIKKNINSAKAKMSNSDTDSLLSRIQEKAERSNFEADSMAELSELEGDSLDKEFANLKTDRVSDSVQEKLERLKRDL